VAAVAVFQARPGKLNPQMNSAACSGSNLRCKERKSNVSVI
jgi:hypothetical protein